MVSSGPWLRRFCWQLRKLYFSADRLCERLGRMTKVAAISRLALFSPVAGVKMRRRPDGRTDRPALRPPVRPLARSLTRRVGFVMDRGSWTRCSRGFFDVAGEKIDAELRAHLPTHIPTILAGADLA